MRILFVYPPTENMLRTLLPRYVEQEVGAYPPLGLASMAAFLRSREPAHTLSILDCPALDAGQPEVCDRATDFQPDLVAITANTFMLLDVVATVETIRSTCPKAKICLGGPHATIYPRETAALEGVDFAVAGEGEEAFAALVDALQSNGSLDRVPGLHCADGVTGPPPEWIEDLDGLPFPARDLLPRERYVSVQGQEPSMTTVFTSRGCPFDCLFCYHAFGRRLRKRSPENVARELALIRDLGIRDAFIFDDTFTADKAWVLEVCREIARRSLDLVFDVRARIDTVDEEVLEALRGVGCRRISYGVEAGNDRTLQYLRKKITTARIREVVALTKRLGFTTFADFMIGSPCETRADVIDTVEFALSLDPDFAQFSATVPYPATDLYAEFLDSGKAPGDYWKAFAENPTPDFRAPLFNLHMEDTEIFELLEQAYSRFYLRPRFVWQRLKELKSPRKFFAYARTALRLLRRG